MFDNKENYAMQGMANTQMVSLPTMKQRLDLAVSRAEDQLSKAKEAREIFSKNPDLERLLDILQSSNI